MKKYVIIIILLQLFWIVASAQTHYGTSSGTLGTNHSYFGYYAGNAAQNAPQVGFVAQEVDALVKQSGYTFSGIETPKNEMTCMPSVTESLSCPW